MSQTSYSMYHGSGKAGAPFDLAAANARAMSGIVSRAGDSIRAGMGLIMNSTTDEDGVRIPAASGIFAGVVQHQMDLQRQAFSSVPYAYTQGLSVPIQQSHKCWVVAEDAVSSLADPVYLRHTVNSTLTPGGFRSDADSAKAFLIPARWVRLPSGAGELAVVEIFALTPNQFFDGTYSAVGHTH